MTIRNKGESLPVSKLCVHRVWKKEIAMNSEGCRDSNTLQIQADFHTARWFFFLSPGFLDNFLKDLEKFTTIHNKFKEYY